MTNLNIKICVNYDGCYKIIIYTARYMCKFMSKIKKVYKNVYDFNYNQFHLWKLKFYSLVMGKIEYDSIIVGKPYNFNHKCKNYNFTKLLK